jgi:hypothetical protein
VSPGVFGTQRTFLVTANDRCLADLDKTVVLSLSQRTQRLLGALTTCSLRIARPFP